jgi:hypothetical protein
MSLSSLNRPTLRMTLMAALAVFSGACSDRSITSSVTPAPVPPTVNANQAGMLRGTVREDGTVVFESLDPSIQAGDSNASGAIYGNQNVTAKVTISAFNLTDNGTTKTWTFKLAVHNLLPYAVGAIDGTSATPFDTVGMFVFFPSAPSVVSPAVCVGCTVTIWNTQGAGNFTAPNQLYYWYHDLLAAKGSPGDSTTHIPTWKFTAPSAVNSFRFFVILSSPWPRGLQSQDTSWSVSYNPLADSLPDVNASPVWKPISLNGGGSESSSSAGLTIDLSHKHGGDDMFFYRSDNLERSENAYIESRLTLSNAGGSKPVMILGLADSVKFVGLGIGNGKIGFATFNQSTLTWEWAAGATLPMSTSAPHTYRVGKFDGTTATVYVDGAEKFSALNSLLPNNFLPSYKSAIGAQAAHLSSFFGATAQDADVKVTVSYVNYAIHATPKP